MASPAPPSPPSPPSGPPYPRPRKPPPSWWWFLGPALLTVAAVAVGVGAFVSTLHEVSTRYGEVRADGEPHALSLPTADRAMVMIPTTISAGDWDCRVTDDRGQSLATSDRGGNVSFSNEASSWESLLTFDPADAGEGRAVTVYVACSVRGDSPSRAGTTVLVTKSPDTAAIVGRVAAMILGPLVLGGAAFAWMIVLIVLQVVRRTGAAA